MSELIQRIRDLELVVLGEHLLPERMVAGIAKQALHVKRDQDEAWLQAQIHNNKRLFDAQKASKTSPSPSPEPMRPEFEEQVTQSNRFPLRKSVLNKAEILLHFNRAPSWRKNDDGSVNLKFEDKGLTWEILLSWKEFRDILSLMTEEQNWLGVVIGQVAGKNGNAVQIHKAKAQIYFLPQKNQHTQMPPLSSHSEDRPLESQV